MRTPAGRCYAGPHTARGGAGWSARRAHNPKVVGSNPTPATTERSSSSPFVITPACVRLGNMRTDVRLQSSAAKRRHEFCDPVHDFISVDSDERRVIDSPPLQRFRHIHQLAMTHLVYPGATHRRFEHSLGTMELAGRVYDIITDPSATNDEVRRNARRLKTRHNGCIGGALSGWQPCAMISAICPFLTQQSMSCYLMAGPMSGCHGSSSFPISRTCFKG